MKMSKTFLLLLILPLVLSGCFLEVKQKETAGAYGGVFRSADIGATWQHATELYTVGAQQVNFNASNVSILALDPLDNAAVYAGTQSDGIFYSYDYGAGWYNTLRDKGVINAIAVDPKYHCTIYAAAHNTIYKSIDCARTWKSIYFETRPGQFVTSLTIADPDSRFIYAGTAGGSFLKSQDYGVSWDVMRRFEGAIKNIIIQNHFNSNTIYVATDKKGVHKTRDGGFTWEDLMDIDVDQAEVDEEELFKQAVFKKLDRSKNLGWSGLTDEQKDERWEDYFEELLEWEQAELIANKYPPLKAIRYTSNTHVLNTDKSVPDGVIFVNRIGIYRLEDRPGDDEMWMQIKLLTPPASEVIHSVMVNEQDANDVYYGTASALYHTVDNGENWAISALPTVYTAKMLNFSPDNKYLYIGVFNTSRR